MQLSDYQKIKRDKKILIIISILELLAIIILGVLQLKYR